MKLECNYLEELVQDKRDEDRDEQPISWYYLNCI